MNIEGMTDRERIENLEKESGGCIAVIAKYIAMVVAIFILHWVQKIAVKTHTPPPLPTSWILTDIYEDKSTPIP